MRARVDRVRTRLGRAHGGRGCDRLRRDDLGRRGIQRRGLRERGLPRRDGGRPHTQRRVVDLRALGRRVAGAALVQRGVGRRPIVAAQHVHAFDDAEAEHDGRGEGHRRDDEPAHRTCPAIVCAQRRHAVHPQRRVVLGRRAHVVDEARERGVVVRRPQRRGGAAVRERHDGLGLLGLRHRSRRHDRRIERVGAGQHRGEVPRHVGAVHVVLDGGAHVVEPGVERGIRSAIAHREIVDVGGHDASSNGDNQPIASSSARRR